MTFNYAKSAATAERLLQRFGAAATLKRVAPGEYDPETGTVAPTETSQPVTAAVFDYDQKMIDGTMIRQGDKRVYLSAAGVSVPLSADLLTWQGEDYTVIAVKPLAPAGTNVLHELQIRK